MPRGYAMDYMFTDFGADSSGVFLRARTNKQTDATERPTPRRRLYSRCSPALTNIETF